MLGELTLAMSFLCHLGKVPGEYPPVLCFISNTVPLTASQFPVVNEDYQRIDELAPPSQAMAHHHKAKLEMDDPPQLAMANHFVYEQLKLVANHRYEGISVA